MRAGSGFGQWHATKAVCKIGCDVTPSQRSQRFGRVHSAGPECGAKWWCGKDVPGGSKQARGHRFGDGPRSVVEARNTTVFVEKVREWVCAGCLTALHKLWLRLFFWRLCYFMKLVSNGERLCGPCGCAAAVGHLLRAGRPREAQSQTRTSGEFLKETPRQYDRRRSMVEIASVDEEYKCARDASLRCG